jgi:hypothetical protein
MLRLGDVVESLGGFNVHAVEELHQTEVLKFSGICPED